MIINHWYKFYYLQGEQPFKIVMSDAKFHVIVKMDTITGCDVDQNLVISDIQLPITYSTVEFDFTNIGSVLGTIVDTIGTIALSFGQGIVLKIIGSTFLSRPVPLFPVPALFPPFCRRQVIFIGRDDSV